MKKIIFSLLFFLPQLNRSQGLLADFFEEHDQFVMNLNVHQGWRTMGEISFGVTSTNDIKFNLIEANEWELGTEFNFDPKHFILAPKLSMNFSSLIMSAGGSLIYYTDFNKGTLYLNPHLGISLLTHVDIYCGYNIPLMRNTMKPFVNHFTVTLAVPIIFD